MGHIVCKKSGRLSCDLILLALGMETDTADYLRIFLDPWLGRFIPGAKAVLLKRDKNSQGVLVTGTKIRYAKYWVALFGGSGS